MRRQPRRKISISTKLTLPRSCLLNQNFTLQSLRNSLALLRTIPKLESTILKPLKDQLGILTNSVISRLDLRLQIEVTKRASPQVGSPKIITPKMLKNLPIPSHLNRSKIEVEYQYKQKIVQ